MSRKAKIAISLVVAFSLLTLLILRLNPRLPLSDSYIMEFAVRRGWYSVVYTQLVLGADPNTPGWRPILIEPIFRNDGRMAATLAEHGADLERQYASGECCGPPLAWALEYRRADIAKMLLRHGADPNYRPKYGINNAVQRVNDIGDRELIELFHEKSSQKKLD